MIEPSFTYFSIDIGDIWNFERNLFLDTFQGIEHIIDLQKKVKSIIIERGTPFLNYQQNKEAYAKEVKLIQQSIELRDSIRLGHFANGDDLYYYNQKILISKQEEDFDFWFALKLSQYDHGLKYIDLFLDYHLEHSYKSDAQDFYNFMILALRQYKKTCLSREVYNTSMEYIDGLPEELSQKENKRPRAKGNFYSFKLSALQSNPRYFTTRKHELKEVFQDLMDYGFIKEKSSFAIFQQIFSNQKVKKDKRIIWIGKYIYLKFCIRFLLDNHKILPMGNDHWVITTKCFVDEDGSDFEIIQLRSARGGVPERIEKLEGILGKL